MIENVPELLSWGPLDDRGRPIKGKKGRIFDAFLNSLRALNYNVEWRIIDTADYGDPQNRKRLIILCRKGRAVIWPATTHADPDDCPEGKLPWRAAREIIDWSLPSRSIFGRARPLKPTTLLRVLYGMNKFSSQPMQPFLLQLRGTAPSQIKSCTRSVSRPLPTITAGGFHTALVQPFMIHTTHQGSNRRCHSLERPVPTITAAHRGELALVVPRVTSYDPGKLEGAVEVVMDADRCRLVDTETGKTVGEMDVLLRMLQPHELAAGMSFPQGYIFTGKTKGDKVKQIGNAVPVETATAMAGALIQDYAVAHN
jgi:DNA (cytosine-5)-methyltransferase 1